MASSIEVMPCGKKFRRPLPNPTRPNPEATVTKYFAWCYNIRFAISVRKIEGPFFIVIVNDWLDEEFDWLIKTLIGFRLSFHDDFLPRDVFRMRSATLSSMDGASGHASGSATIWDNRPRSPSC